MAENTTNKPALEALESFLLNEDLDTWESMTLQVVFCNPLGGYSFREAVVTTQEMLSTFSGFPTQVSKTLPLKTCWDIEKLQNLARFQRRRSEGGVKSTNDRQKSGLDRENAAFELLNNYLKEFDAHRLSLTKILKRLSVSAEGTDATDPRCGREGRVASLTEVLNIHLFSRLSFEDSLINDQICSSGMYGAGCGVDIQRGNTLLGSDITWHGHIDMMINGTIPLKILEDEENTSRFQETAEQGQTGTNYGGSDIDEIRYKKRIYKNQLIAETITNAFAQTNVNTDLLGLPIPAFGCLLDKIYVYSYDCRSDILLKKMNVLKIDEENLTPVTIVKIWLYIHFSLFMRSDLTDLDQHQDLRDYTANFLSCNENITRFYSKLEPGAPIYPKSSHERTLKLVGLKS